MGESHLRIALEREAMYATEFPFIDYGVDLDTMAEMEQGIRIEKLNTTELDAKMPPAKQKDVEDYLNKLKCRRSDRIPIKFDGKGSRGYMLYDWVHHKGHGAPKVNKHFEDLVRKQGTENEHLIPNQMQLKRSKVGGVRFALQYKRQLRKWQQLFNLLVIKA